MVYTSLYPCSDVFCVLTIIPVCVVHVNKELKLAKLNWYYQSIGIELIIDPHFYKSLLNFPGGGGTRMARGGIRLVHGLTKSTLITYFQV